MNVDAGLDAIAPSLAPSTPCTEPWAHRIPGEIDGCGDTPKPREEPVVTEKSSLTEVEQSSSFEHLVETTFLSELIQEMWFVRGQLIDVMHSTVDAFGYDLVLQAGPVIRHVQLKAKRKSARTARYNLSVQLQNQPAACAIVMEWEPNEAGRIQLDYRFLGGGPFERIPDLGDTLAKHTKGNAQGVKGTRAALRVVALGKFERLPDIAALTARLFGDPVVQAD